jgi:dihydropteroate synthase
VYGTGYSAVGEKQELDRVIPVIEILTQELRARVSVDTTKAEVARHAIKAGACIVNDTSCAHNKALLEVVAATGVEYVVMHNRGQGEIEASNARYTNVVSDVLAEIQSAANRAVEAGVEPSKIWIDPGVGFAKTAQQSIELLRSLPQFVATGYKVMVGASRKSFIDTLGQEHGLVAAGVDQRLGGSVAIICVAAVLGCHAVRVHDVQPSAQALALVDAIGIKRT